MAIGTRRNDLILGAMTLILMATVGATAYYGLQNSKNAIARKDAEIELDQAQKSLESKQATYAKQSDTNSRLNTELNQTKDVLDETALKLQKMEEMIAKGGNSEPGETDNVALEIARKNIQDLTRRLDEMESFSEAVRSKLQANTNDEALVLLNASRKTDDETSPKVAANKVAEKQTNHPFVRVRNENDQQLASNSVKKTDAEATVPPVGAIDLKSPRGPQETSSREQPAPSTANSADEDPSLVRVTDKPALNIDSPALESDTLENQVLKQQLAEMEQKLQRRERLLQEQAELIDRIKPAKSGAQRETGRRTIREEPLEAFGANDGFSSDPETVHRQVYEVPADASIDSLNAVETIIETIILP